MTVQFCPGALVVIKLYFSFLKAYALETFESLLLLSKLQSNFVRNEKGGETENSEGSHKRSFCSLRSRISVAFAHLEGSHSGQLHEFRKLEGAIPTQVQILHPPQRNGR